jgi:hypothetical protein
VRALRERTLLGLALVVSRVQVNQLAKPVPSVRAAMYRLQTQTQRHAALLASEQVSRYEVEPRTAQSSNALYETMRGCSRVFPREAAVLLRALRADWEPSVSP